MAEPEDDDLIDAIVHRDPTALTTLYDRHGRLAFALAYRVLDDAAAAEEVVQDAFLLVWRRAVTFDAARGSGVRAWLLTIVHHRAIDVLRRSRRHRQAVGLEAVDASLAVPSVWGEVARGLDRDEVRAAVDELPEDQRRAIELAYYEDLTHREIVERTGASLGTVKGRLRLGLRKLHTSLISAQEKRGGGQAPDSSGSGTATPPPAGERQDRSDATHGR